MYIDTLYTLVEGTSGGHYNLLVECYTHLVSMMEGLIEWSSPTALVSCALFTNGLDLRFRTTTTITTNINSTRTGIATASPMLLLSNSVGDSGAC